MGKVARQVGHHAARAARAIVMQKNVGAAVASGNTGAIGAALTANALSHGASYIPKKIRIGGKTIPISGKNIRDVTSRLKGATNGKALLNVGDAKIAAKVAARTAANAYLKGKQKRAAHAVINRVVAHDKRGTKLINSGDRKIAGKWIAGSGAKNALKQLSRIGRK